MIQSRGEKIRMKANTIVLDDVNKWTCMRLNEMWTEPVDRVAWRKCPAMCYLHGLNVVSDLRCNISHKCHDLRYCTRLRPRRFHRMFAHGNHTSVFQRATKSGFHRATKSGFQCRFVSNQYLTQSFLICETEEQQARANISGVSRVGLKGGFQKSQI